MELGPSNTLLAGDPRLVDHIVGEVKSQGIFDQFRKECIADVDTKPAYQNLRTRVEGSVNSFLGKQSWKPDLNKNQLRENLRKHIHEASYLDVGVERIVDQVVNPKVYSVFMPQIEDVVYKFLGIERPKAKEKNGACGLKDLLPKDLDPVSPESDKNSLKDVSLESVDAIDDLDIKKEEKLCYEEKMQEDETSNEKSKDANSENGEIFNEDKTLDESGKLSNKTGSNLNLNTSARSDDKTEEDEEDSPTFEPIDIMNLNESNISNDSHLSGISELTSHRSRSPDFCNELSRDHFEYSNQDSQLSKVSSDSRLSIVTDFGSSNHASTPFQDSLKDEVNRDKYEVNKGLKENFKAVREFGSCKTKNAKLTSEPNKGKDLQDIKDSKSIRNNLSPKESSQDAVDSSSVKDKYEHKNNKDKTKDSESKSKLRDKYQLKDGKHNRDRSTDKKKQRTHSSSKYDKYDKNKSKDKNDQPKENAEKTKDTENLAKDSSGKLKEDKQKELEKKDSNSKEAKDLKDLYKEKIRELREKKELTEKEKLNKDNKEVKPNKENKDKKDSPKDKKSYKKEHKSSSSKTSLLGLNENKLVKSSEKLIDGKEKRNESKDKAKRDEKRTSKDIKSKNHLNAKSDSTEKSDKQDIKKIKEEKSEKLEVSKKEVKSSSEKANGKKDAKNHSQSKSSSRGEKLDGKRDGKSDSQTKDKKRRDDKKSKTKDDHSSLRKNSNDRRSTDRDGSNGSSSKSSQSSNSSSNATNNKSSASNLSKETSHVSNSSSETSDSIEEAHTNGLKLSLEQTNYKMDITNLESHNEHRTDEISNGEARIKQVESEFSETNLPLKKRPLLSDDSSSSLGSEIVIKKPKFAKNIHEAKKLMKIRKRLEKQKLRESRKLERKLQHQAEEIIQPNTTATTSTTSTDDNLEKVPDEERVQIIEIPDEEYEEPYPEQQSSHWSLTLEERSLIMMDSEPGTKDLKLSDIELCIQQSLIETLPVKKIEEKPPEDKITDFESQCKEASKDTEEIIPPATSDPVESSKMEIAVKQHSENEDIQDVAASTVKIEAFIPEKLEFHDPTIDVKETGKAEEQVELPVVTDNRNVNDEDYSKDEKASTSSKNAKDYIPTDTPSASNDLGDSKNETTTVADSIEDCRYFQADDEKSERFASFLESLELVENVTLEDMIESLGGQIVSSMPKAMAPPLPKRKHSSSPLTDILLNNSNNNNDGHKKALNVPNEDVSNSAKKRKVVPPKKQRLQANPCASQGLLNGENFVMPLSPESDVSATSEKIPSSQNLIKEDKSRQRSSQRYSSDDLYKPRPLFSSSSRRSRRSNQA